MIATQAIQLYRKFIMMSPQREADVNRRFPDRMDTPSARRKFIYLFEQSLKQLKPQEQEILTDETATVEITCYNECLSRFGTLIQNWVEPYISQKKV